MNLEPNLTIIHNFWTAHHALFDALASGVNWDESMAARKTASFGVPYNYSQISYPFQEMHPEILPLLDSLHARLGILFNNCLLNFYETGDGRMGFHSDDTSNLVPNTGVAIVSLGSIRRITYRSIEAPTVLCNYDLPPGSLLYMDDAVQTEWLHAIKKQKGAGPRISLTFRAFRQDE